MRFVCYILYSPSLNCYYVGVTSNGEALRLEKHNTGFYKGSFTQKATDWEMYHLLEADDFAHSIRIERKIKKMKSKRYIENLKKYSELTFNIIQETRQRT